MKKLEAIIKPYLLEEIRDALEEAGFSAMTISEIRSFEGLKEGGGEWAYYGPVPIEVDFEPRLKVELVVQLGQEGKAVEAIHRIASGTAITVQPMHDVIRIRTNERGEIAV